MANHNNPTLTSSYANFVTELDSRLDDLAFMLDPTKTTVTNPPAGSVRWSGTTKRFERWSGSAWAELLIKANDDPYDIRAALANDVSLTPNGGTAKTYGQVGRAAQSNGVNDANLYTEAGTWYVISADAVSNFPIYANGGFLCVDARYDAGTLRQVWYHGGSAGIIYTRHSFDSGSTWSDWWKITANADWNAASGADGFIANKPTLGTAAAAAVQTSATDTTAGRIMAVGAFGLGSINCIARTTALTDITVTGFYSHTSVSALSIGAPLASAGVLIHLNYSSTYAVQIWYSAGFTKAYIRGKNTSVWTGWSLIFNQSTVLGSVSQSAGVPTGAIFERGATANGEYVRFADGTQICTYQATETDGAVTAAGALYKSTTPYTWVFPAAFISTTSTQVFASMQSAAIGLANARIVSTSSAEIHKWVPATETALRIFRLTAIGRWF